tara:strand:- start:7842 stop:8384 length:543 start_codon:yes stop_codon:yes gene_type:complete
MKKLIVLLCLGLLVACEKDDEAIRAQQERMVAEQPITNPFFGEGPMADIEVSDEELREFVLLNMDFGRIQAEARQKIIDILREEELSTDSYNSISHALNMNFTLDEYNFSESDLEKFDIAKERISEVEEEVDEKIESEIEQSNFTMDRFLDLNVAANHNIEIMERAREMALKLTIDDGQD